MHERVKESGLDGHTTLLVLLLSHYAHVSKTLLLAPHCALLSKKADNDTAHHIQTKLSLNPLSSSAVQLHWGNVYILGH